MNKKNIYINNFFFFFLQKMVLKEKKTQPDDITGKDSACGGKKSF